MRARFVSVLAAVALLAGCAVLAGCATTVGPGSTGALTTSSGTVMVNNGPAGAYLTDGQARSLYLFVADTGSTSTCTGACATAWPPLLVTGAPQAGPGAMASLLGTTGRADGTSQVTYGGHPLYYFANDKAPGAALGQGSNGSGALWWLVAPDGAAITTPLLVDSTDAPAMGGY